jgi:uncharacterized protein YqgC (DUF456 family)
MGSSPICASNEAVKTATSFALFVLELGALAAAVVWADRRFRRRGSGVGRVAVWTVTSVVVGLFVVLPLLGLLLLWYLGHAE